MSIVSISHHQCSRSHNQLLPDVHMYIIYNAKTQCSVCSVVLSDADRECIDFEAWTDEERQSESDYGKNRVGWSGSGGEARIKNR